MLVTEIPACEEVMPEEVRQYIKNDEFWETIEVNHWAYGPEDGEDEEDVWQVVNYSFLKGTVQSKNFYYYYERGELMRQTSDVREIAVGEMKSWLKEIEKVHKRGVA